MFAKIPPLTNIEAKRAPCSMTKAFQLFHSTVTDVSYRSTGELRKSETHCIFHYTIKGHGEVIYKGMPYITNEEEGFFNIINESNSGYGYPLLGSEPWEFVVICFKDGNVREVVKELLESDVKYRVNPEGIYLMCKKLLECHNSDTSINIFPKLVSMLDNAHEPTAKISSIFQNIVGRDLLKNPTIFAIAAEMKISREHLQRQYFKETGITPRKYISDKRFERLCYFLTTHRSEAEIADMMNFSSTAEMRVFFKRHAQKTPRQYRNTGFISI